MCPPRKCRVSSVECRVKGGEIQTRHSSLVIRHSQSGIALLIVVSLLTVIGVMGVAFAFSMYLETREAGQYVSTHQARYLAEAGIAHARAVLDEDRTSSSSDDSTETWAMAGRGSEADTDGDRAADSRWWTLSGSQEALLGHYAWQTTDESGKVNINAAYANAGSVAPAAIDLVAILQRSQLDASKAQTVAQAIVSYRLGPDGKPGKAGVDDDADGAIDEADEYQPLAALGDDCRIEELEELAAIAGLNADELARVGKVATTYSWDLNVTASGKARVNVNTASASELLTVLLDAGVANPWQAAVNLADHADSDVELSRVTKSSQSLFIPNEGALGDWSWSESPSGHYTTSRANGPGLSWSVAVPTGTFRVIVRGISGKKVGDVTLAGQTTHSVDSDQSVGTLALSGTVSITVVHHEAEGTVCAFSGIELVTESAQSGVVIRGIEAIRINEVMPEPVIALAAAQASFSPLGSDWGCPVGSQTCSNSGVGQARWSWTVPALPAGRYYVRVFGESSGQTVGVITIDGDTPSPLLHGQVHPATLWVGSDHKVDLVIAKNASAGTYYFKEVHLSVQPDGEYVELINLTDADMDVSGWVIEGELTGGRQARLPAGAILKAHGLLAAVVDWDDHQTGLANNGISAREAWEMTSQLPVAQLEFPGGVPSADDDWLKASLPPGTPPRLILRKGQSIVDEVEYPLNTPSTTGFQSLEKADPSVVVDANANGLDDGWFASLRLYTPGAANDNDGLKETVGWQTIVHDPTREVSVLNRPLSGIGEVAGLSSGVAWKPFSSEELAKVVDRLTVYSHRLEAEGHFVAGLGAEQAWQERAEGWFEHSDPALNEVAAQWQWTGLTDGHYRLSLYGWSGEQMAVRWKKADQSFTSYSPALSADIQGRITVGLITVGMGQTPPNSLTVEVQCGGISGVCHLDAVGLDPQLIRVGPVNVNTALREVFLALPGMTEALADRLIAGRPYGNQEGKARGIGDLLLKEVLGPDDASKLAVFEKLGHWVTVRSSVFQILSLGEALKEDKPMATQRIKTVVQR